MAIAIEKNYKEEQDQWTIKLSGEMDINSSDEVKQELQDIIDQNIADIEIDCAELSYIDSTGIGVLIGILKKIKKSDKKIVLKNTKDNIKRLFNITGLDKIFIIE
jgi:anti-sigma B factor antagonist